VVNSGNKADAQIVICLEVSIAIKDGFFFHFCRVDLPLEKNLSPQKIGDEFVAVAVAIECMVCVYVCMIKSKKQLPFISNLNTAVTMKPLVQANHQAHEEDRDAPEGSPEGYTSKFYAFVRMHLCCVGVCGVCVCALCVNECM
jgi:hypothetical protein